MRARLPLPSLLISPPASFSPVMGLFYVNASLQPGLNFNPTARVPLLYPPLTQLPPQCTPPPGFISRLASVLPVHSLTD